MARAPFQSPVAVGKPVNVLPGSLVVGPTDSNSGNTATFNAIPGALAAEFVNSGSGVYVVRFSSSAGGDAGSAIEWFDTTNTQPRGFIGFGSSGVNGGIISDFGISPAGSGSVCIGTANAASIGTRFASDGGIVAGTPTGGTKGFGTINASSIYINGVLVNGGGTGPTYKHKTAGLGRTNNTSAADPDLTFSLGVGTFQFEIYCLVFQGSGGNIGFGCGVGYSSTLSANSSFWSHYSWTNGASLIGGAFTVTASGGGNSIGFNQVNTNSSSPDFVRITGVVTTTGSGNLALWWSQITTSASATTLAKSSWMSVVQI